MSKAQRFTYKAYPNAESRVYSAKRLISLLRGLLQQNPEIIQRHATDVLGTAIWKLTEAETRKYETRYCSKAVWDSRNSIQEELNHEHVFQKSIMAAALLKCTSEEVEGILENAVACTVFEREHRKLPKKLEKLDGWKRYKWAGIVVVDAKQTSDPSNPVYVQETV